MAIPLPGDLPDPGIEPGFPALRADSSFFVCLFFLQADSLPSESPGNLKLFKIEFTFSLSVALQMCLL